MSLLKRLFAGGPGNDPALIDLYGRIVAQSRRPSFYAELGVADTPEGRFDLLALHAFLVMDPLSKSDPEAAQRLFDLMFDDLDANLRELGVSDIRIGARVKKLAKAFFGRSKAYREALAHEEDGPLADVLDRNLYAKTPSDPRHLALMAAYVRKAHADPRAAAEGRFPPPPQADESLPR